MGLHAVAYKMDQITATVERRTAADVAAPMPAQLGREWISSRNSFIVTNRSRR
jgi:hypothetical protein